MNGHCGKISLYFHFLQDCAAVILYAAEQGTKVALDAIQILGMYVCSQSVYLYTGIKLIQLLLEVETVFYPYLMLP